MIDPDKLLEWPFPVTEHTFAEKDSILYALGVGLGADPTDEAELPFVYERDHVVLPTMAAVIGHPGPWFRHPDTGIDWVRVVHGEQTLRMHQRLTPGDRLTCHTHVVDVEDKGEGRGALVRWARTLSNASGLVASMESTLFCRADGGFGGPVRATPTPEPWPETPPDVSVERAISPRAALIYRLSGDFNPVHADPKVAAQAGFVKPILHGLCTFAVATYSVLQALSSRIGAGVDDLDTVHVRFKAPVLPGQCLRTDLWMGGQRSVRFRSFSDSGGRMVLDAGSVTLKES